MRDTLRSMTVVLLLLGGTVIVVEPAGASPAAPPTIEQIALPASTSPPADLVVGPDGNLWVALRPDNRLARVTPDGEVTDFPVPDGSGLITGLATGSDGNLWAIGNAVHRVSPDGAVTSFPLPAGACCGGSAVAGADGNVWFLAGLQIGRVTPAGVITMFSLPPTSTIAPHDIVAGPDGNVWYERSQALGRVTPLGMITEFPTDGSPWSLTAGPDGTLWYGNVGKGRLGRMRPDGSLAAPVPLPSIHTSITAIGLGPDGAVWIGGEQPGSGEFVARIEASGAMIDFVIPEASDYEPAYTTRLLAGPDGALWLLLSARARLGRLELGPSTRTILTTSAPSVDEGEAVTLTAHVEAPFHPGTPTGTVTFTDRGVALGPPVALEGGSASITVTLPPTYHPVRASYTSDLPYRSSVSYEIAQLTRLAVAIDAQPVFFGVNTAPAVQAEPDMLRAYLSRVDGGEPFALSIAIVDFVDADGRPLCWVNRPHSRPEYAYCDISGDPEARSRVIAGGGFTAIVRRTDIVTGASDHAELAEART